MNGLRILHTSDFHGKLDSARATHLRSLRSQNCLAFDCGDGIKTGNLGIPVGPEPYWKHLVEAGTDAVTLGNRESHVLRALMARKIAGAATPILVGNLTDVERGAPFPASQVFEIAGQKVGALGVMVPMVTERMATKAASQFLWTDPISRACELAEELRPQVDLVIALTHIGHSHDENLARLGPKIDIILGGHSHTVLQEPECLNGIWISHTGSHGRYVAVYEWDGSRLAGNLQPLAL